MTRLYAEHCGRTYEEFERAMDRDRFMTAEEALEWGLMTASSPNGRSALT